MLHVQDFWETCYNIKDTRLIFMVMISVGELDYEEIIKIKVKKT